MEKQHILEKYVKKYCVIYVVTGALQRGLPPQN